MKRLNLKEEIKKILEAFNIDNSLLGDYKKIAIPSKIAELLMVEKNELVQWVNVPSWNLFEEGEIDWGIQEFIKLCFGDAKEYSDEITFVLVTDELIAEENAVEIEFGKIEERLAEYEDKFHMEFFQPSDYILFIPSSKELILIHHDGKIGWVNSNL